MTKDSPADDGTKTYTLDGRQMFADALACAVLVFLYGTTAAVVTGVCMALMRPLIDMANHAIAYRIHCHHGLVMKLQLAEPQAKHDALTRSAWALALHVLFMRMIFTHDLGGAVTLTGSMLGIAVGLRLLVPALVVYVRVRRRASTVHGPARFKWVR
jgi:hypothetical protein